MKVQKGEIARFACRGLPQWAQPTEFARYVGVAVFAGFDGIDFQSSQWLPPDARPLVGVLKGSGLALTSLTVRAEWRGAQESEREVERADHWIAFARSFPGARLVLEQITHADRSDIYERQLNVVQCLAAVGLRAQAAGVTATFCPDSAPGSLFRFMDDYHLLFGRLGEAPVGFTPDLRHIAQGGMDAIDVIHTFRDRVDHVRLGTGLGSDVIGDDDTDRARVVAYLAHTGFAGWFVLDLTHSDPLSLREEHIQAAGRYVKERLVPLVAEAHRARAEEANRRSARDAPNGPPPE